MANRGLWTGVGSGAVAGAGAGATLGPWGAVGGAVIGGVAGAFAGNADDETLAEKQAREDAQQKIDNQNKALELENMNRGTGLNALDFLTRQQATAQTAGNLRGFRNQVAFLS